MKSLGYKMNERPNKNKKCMKAYKNVINFHADLKFLIFLGF